MANPLPSRPNLEHLKKQAKALLAGWKAREPQALASVREHLPAAAGCSAEQIGEIPFQLADAQSVIARQYGFASWAILARHVETLRALGGDWAFERLEIEGNLIPLGAVEDSRLLIDGDRFRTESPDAQGTLVINAQVEPHQIELRFVEGPEAGNSNFGIFRVDGDRFELCLDMNGRPAPKEFCTAAGSGQACEILQRVSSSRPKHVSGGVAKAPPPSSPTQSREGFEMVESLTLTRLGGEWSCVQLLLDGKPLPDQMRCTGLRSMSGNEIKISFGGRTIIQALIRVNEQTDPIQIDYYNLEGTGKGTIQQGIMQWIGEEFRSCMAGAGKPRPTDFTCPVGSGRTLSQWKRKS